MSDINAIEQVGNTLQTATSYVAIFGSLSGSDVGGRRSALRKQFSYLAQLVHPDHAPKGAEKKAAEVFDRLNRARQSAEAAIKARVYEQPFCSSTNLVLEPDEDMEFVVQSMNGVYRLSKEPFRSGDFSVLYRGYVSSHPGERVLAKISSEPVHNVWLETEASILSQFRDAKSGDPLSGIRQFVPGLLDTFLVSGESSTRFRVNIMREIPDLVSVAEIIEAYPYGLAPQEAVWVFRRIIAQTLAASMAGVVHGAMIPDHVLVDPFKHEPLHIGWAHAICDPKQSGKRITHVIDRWRDLYPPEVFEKKLPDHRTDLFMAGKIMIKLLGGDVKHDTLPKTVPDSIARIILHAVEKSPGRRPQDGAEFLDEFTRVIRKEWGRMYRLLTMPIH